MDKLSVVKLYDDAKLPTRKHKGDAGLDLYAHMSDGEYGVDVPPGNFAIINTGIAVFLNGRTGFLWPKSKSDFLLGGGVIDAGYLGELKVKIFNPTIFPLRIHHGDAIAQLVIQKVETPEVVEVTAFDEETERGTTGGIVYQQATLVSKVTGVE